MTQPLDKRKKGFGTKDAYKTDEFCSAIRTEQYREGMRKEIALMKKNSNQVSAFEASARAQSAPPLSSTHRDTLFDIGRTKVTEFDPKSTRDMYYKFNKDSDKKLGTYRPESTVVGHDSWNIQYKPPSHGAASLVKVSSNLYYLFLAFLHFLLYFRISLTNLT